MKSIVVILLSAVIISCSGKANSKLTCYISYNDSVYLYKGEVDKDFKFFASGNVYNSSTLVPIMKALKDFNVSNPKDSILVKPYDLGPNFGDKLISFNNFLIVNKIRNCYNRLIFTKNEKEILDVFDIDSAIMSSPKLRVPQGEDDEDVTIDSSKTIFVTITSKQYILRYKNTDSLIVETEPFNESKIIKFIKDRVSLNKCTLVFKPLKEAKYEAFMSLFDLIAKYDIPNYLKQE